MERRCSILGPTQSRISLSILEYTKIIALGVFRLSTSILSVHICGVSVPCQLLLSVFTDDFCGIAVPDLRAPYYLTSAASGFIGKLSGKSLV